MKLSSDDLPMFFDDAHRALAERLRLAAASSRRSRSLAST